MEKRESKHSFKAAFSFFFSFFTRFRSNAATVHALFI